MQSDVAGKIKTNHAPFTTAHQSFISVQLISLKKVTSLPVKRFSFGTSVDTKA
jgi:hypothetical protein